jgi:hypothetical protein
MPRCSRLALGLTAAALLLPVGCRRAPVPADEPEEIVPVFPRAGGPIDARAQRLCQVLHELPARARTGCCGGSPGITLTDACTRALSLSLGAGAVTLDEPALKSCEQEAAAALSGCQWVGPHPPDPPAACRRLIAGRLDRGQRCRSNLECQPGTFCRGLGPTDLGRCAPPQPTGSLCRTGVDPLAGYLRQPLERAHPECEGFCHRNRCFAALASGATCRVDEQCGPAGRCAGRSCVAGAAGSRGEPCVPGGCQDGLRCIGGACRPPGSGGAACQTDAECLGACQAGRCSRRC